MNKSEINESVSIVIGEKILQARIKKNWSISDLSQIAGIDRKYLSMIEKGRVSISANKLFDLLNALGLESDELYNEVKSLKNNNWQNL